MTIGTRDMPLTLPEVTRLFDVTENTVRGWINDDNLPCEAVDDRYRFNRTELLEWATLRKLNVSPSIFGAVNGSAVSESSLAAALERGGISYDVHADHKRAVLRAVVDGLPLPCDFDRDVLLQLFLAREALGSTALVDGIAVPHPRRPIVLDVPRPLLRLCFLSQPLEFEAVDRKPVDTVIALVCPTVHEHLQTLARLACVLKDPQVRRVLKERAPKPDILAAVAHAEHVLGDRSGGSI